MKKRGVTPGPGICLKLLLCKLTPNTQLPTFIRGVNYNVTFQKCLHVFDLFILSQSAIMKVNHLTDHFGEKI